MCTLQLCPRGLGAPPPRASVVGVPPAAAASIGVDFALCKSCNNKQAQQHNKHVEQLNLDWSATSVLLVVRCRHMST
jgi:hypothetical protein